MHALSEKTQNCLCSPIKHQDHNIIAHDNLSDLLALLLNVPQRSIYRTKF